MVVFRCWNCRKVLREIPGGNFFVQEWDEESRSLGFCFNCIDTVDQETPEAKLLRLLGGSNAR